MRESMLVHTSETPPRGPVYQPIPDNVRTCRTCGTDEIVENRFFKTGFGMTAFLGCGHFQNDDEY